MLTPALACLENCIFMPFMREIRESRLLDYSPFVSGHRACGIV